MKSADTASTKSEDFKSEVSGPIRSSSFSHFLLEATLTVHLPLPPSYPALLLPIAGVAHLHNQLHLQTNASFIPPEGLRLQVGKQQSENSRPQSHTVTFH